MDNVGLESFLLEDGGLLLVFVKNPKKGYVKTRLAKGVGEEQALNVYLKLLDYTRKLVDASKVPTKICYSDQVEENDVWSGLEKEAQCDGDLGERMEHAFATAFSQGFSKVVIIGSDCAELNSTHIQKAFKQLNEHDVVFGPAKDGGYYLMGMKKLEENVFRNKPWSQSTLLNVTLEELEGAGKRVGLLEELSDVDTIEDLKRLGGDWYPLS